MDAGLLAAFLLCLALPYISRIPASISKLSSGQVLDAHQGAVDVGDSLTSANSVNSVDSQNAAQIAATLPPSPFPRRKDDSESNDKAEKGKEGVEPSEEGTVQPVQPALREETEAEELSNDTRLSRLGQEPVPRLDLNLSLLTEDPVGKLKVFVYTLPHSFNRKVLKKDPRCLHHMFAAEMHFHDFILQSNVRTYSPESADWFYTPVYSTCDLTEMGMPLPFRAPRMMRASIAYIAQKYPYWNKSQGADHFFIVPHDFGACFHYQEEKAISRGTLNILKHATLVQTFGQYNHTCMKQGSIVVPPYAPPHRMHSHLIPKSTLKSIFVYFRGSFYDKGNDPEGGYYARGARASIWENFKDNPLFDISYTRPVTYYEDMQRSVFCLCPLGWAPWSPRIVESVFFGCIPVIIADDIVLPFAEAFPWLDIAVFVNEVDVPQLDSILGRIGPRKIRAMQRRLAEPAIRRAVIFHHPSQSGDAFHQVLNSLGRLLPVENRYEREKVDWRAGPPDDLNPWKPDSPIFWR